MKYTTISSIIISSVLHPLVMPILMILILFCVPSVFSMIPLSMKLLTLGLSILFVTIIPAFGMIVLKYYKLISNYELTIRLERVYPLLITIVSVGCGFLAIKGFNYIPLVKQLYLVFIVLLSIFALITMWWKISMHMTGIGGLCGFLFLLGAHYSIPLQGEMMMALLGAGLLGFARLALKRHTPMQVLMGFLLGFAVIAVLMW